MKKSQEHLLPTTYTRKFMRAYKLAKREKLKIAMHDINSIRQPYIAPKGGNAFIIQILPES